MRNEEGVGSILPSLCLSLTSLVLISFAFAFSLSYLVGGLTLVTYQQTVKKKKAGWLLTILCSTGGGDGKNYGWFGRKVQREYNVVEGVSCLWGQRVYL